ncbi:MAG: hypothetical protein KGH63_03895 [Candidatus Micrarchaeota archaeon]|nr:hypothetical protein [Candidatus Micrarchaeota archaeon]
MFGLMATLKKLALLIILPPLLLVGAAWANWSAGQAALLIAAYVAGMLFPDLDVITGLLRTTFRAVLLVFLVVIAVVAFPTAWAHAGGYCPTGAIQGVLSTVNAMIACQIALAMLSVAVAWAATGLLVGWIPEKDSFHHWTSGILFSGGLALVAGILRLTGDYLLLGLGFGVGYALHLLADNSKNQPDPGWLNSVIPGAPAKK